MCVCVCGVVVYGRGVISWYPVPVSIIQFLLKSLDSFSFHNLFAKLIPFIHSFMRKTILNISSIIIFLQLHAVSPCTPCVIIIIINGLFKWQP